ncbi:MAG: hypothetical protein COB07_05370 [Sulfurovum sp.]|nr:MAG: hypothetical protein COB07_05370 [Sulfurovum sp.]
MTRSKHLALSILLIGLMGCTKAPALKIYSLEIPAVGAVHSSPYRSKSIKVAYPQSLKEQISQKMYFSYSSSDRGNYQNSEWSNTVSKLLQGTFIEVLDSSRLFKAVLFDTSAANEDYRLESTVFAFSHSVRGTASYALVSIQFNLIDTNTGRLVKSKRFSYREETDSVDAQGYAAATNVALARLSRDLVRWLR